jgi:hypothetical protein
MQLAMTVVTMEGMIRLLQYKVWGKFSVFIASVSNPNLYGEITLSC